MQGIVFDIKRFAVHDGPGIRTTVFLKGCPLKCFWCHNPESIDARPIQSTKKIKLDDVIFDRQEQVGISISVSQVIDILKKDLIFMEESEGGVTFSGGEPTMQPDFLCQLLQACKREGIHTAVDTCGYTSRLTLATIAPHTDLFLFDLKHADPVKHEAATGRWNGVILENLGLLLQMGKKVQIRIPIIPGFNNTNEDVTAMASLLTSFNCALERVDLLPYHTIAQHKYKRFGIDNRMEGIKALNKQEVSRTKEIFENAGFKVKIGG